jgi:hypothetical protein
MHSRSGTTLHDPLPTCPRFLLVKSRHNWIWITMRERLPLAESFSVCSNWQPGGEGKLTSRILILLSYCLWRWSLLISNVIGKPYWIIVPNYCKNFHSWRASCCSLGFILKSVLVYAYLTYYILSNTHLLVIYNLVFIERIMPFY